MNLFHYIQPNAHLMYDTLDHLMSLVESSGCKDSVKKKKPDTKHYNQVENFTTEALTYNVWDVFAKFSHDVETLVLCSLKAKS